MCRAVTVLAFVFLLNIGPSAALSALADQQDNSTVPKGYPSPGEAFEAFRNARRTGDWRTMLFSLTERGRDGAVFAAYHNSLFNANPKVVATRKNYGLTPERVIPKYNKEYREKHGVDIWKIEEERERHWDAYRKACAEYKKKQTGRIGDGTPEPSPPTYRGPPLPAVDAELLSEVVVRFATDKVAFYEEMNTLLFPQKDAILPRSKLGDLRDLRASGSTAAGRVSVTRYHLRSGAGGEVVEPDLPWLVPVTFLKVRGRWFLQAPPCP